MLDLGLLQHAGKEFVGLDRGGADQHRLAALDAGADVLDHRVPLLVGGTVDLVVLVLAPGRAVGRDDHGLEAVDLLELEGLGVGGAGHAGELAVHAEVVLEGDRGQGLVLGLDAHAFLGLDRLVQAVGPAPAGHQATGELVDDDDLAVLHHVLLVAVVEGVGAQGGVEVMHQQDVAGVVEPAALGEQAHAHEDLLGGLVARLGQQHLVRLEVDRVVARLDDLVLVVEAALLALEHGRDLVHLQVQLGVVLGLAGNDQRRARLVDEDGVHLVDDREVERALHALADRIHHVVAQVIEAELVVGAVGDVGGVGGLLLVVRHARQVAAGGEPEEAVDAAHPLGVAAGEVVVHRDHMHPTARQRVEVGGQRGDQRLALAGAHLGDLAVVQHHAADELDVEVAHAVHPLASLAHHGEGFGQQRVERLAVGHALAELRGLAAQRLVGQRGDLGLEGVDLAHGVHVLADEAVVATTEDFLEQAGDHVLGSTSIRQRREFIMAHPGSP